MKPPLFVRSLSPDEYSTLRAGLRSPSAFALRRSQILLAGAEGLKPSLIRDRLGCATQAVRHALHAFAAEGTACLHQKSHRPRSARPALDAARRERLRAVLHHSPRDFGKPTGVWTLATAAGVGHELEITDRLVSHEAIRQALNRLGVGWKRAKTWITSPDPACARKERARDRLIRLAASHPDRVLGFQDEVWWSRLERPAMHAWSDGGPVRLRELEAVKEDADPKALACHGLLRGDTGGMMLRSVEGRPVSRVTGDFLGWACERLAVEGKKALLLVRDNAAWHVSGRARAWIRAHNRRARAEGGVRIIACYLPVKAPWLNRIEPRWAHGKRAIVEPDRKLTAAEVEERVCGYYGCERLDRLAQQVA